MFLRLSYSLLLAVFLAPVAFAENVRLKELVDVQGVRDNELIGYGLVVGLSGTGDTEQVLFTSQSISGMLGRLGIRISPRDIRSRNVAAVMVTAKLPTFARAGSRIDVVLGSMGNARSLTGGVLLITPLMAGDGKVYAVAQGAVQTGGFEAGAAGSMIRLNQPTSARIPAGATVEQSVTPEIGKGPLLLSLKTPDFTNATRIVEAIEGALGEGSAKALDPAGVEVQVPQELLNNPVKLMAQLEVLEVNADQRAKVVVSERTGTVVAGAGVRLRPAAIAYGGLRVAINTTPVISQPSAFARQGETVSTAMAEVSGQDSSRGAVALPATSSVDDLVKALNTLGASPRDLISILQGLKAAGALDADLEVM